jgi:zinc/manganese transport system permease protein
VSLYGGFLDSVTGLLFGSFLGVSDGQVVALVAVGAAAVVAMLVLARPLYFATVDRDVATARGVPERALSVAFLLVLGCTAAEVSQVTGTLLVFALLVMPAAAAQQLTARPVVGLCLSVGLGLAVVWSALGVAFYSTWPVGFFVSTFGFATYLAAVGIRLATDRRRRPYRRAAPVPATPPAPTAPTPGMVTA